MTEPSRLATGDKAPDFTLPDHAGAQISLADFQGQWVLVYFYPAAGTPGCTKQACDFRDNLGLLNHAGYQVIGISPDTPEKLAKFREAEQLPFSLLADPEKRVLREWGAFGEKKNYGKIVQGVIRSTFVINPEGTVDKALYNVRATGHVAKLLRDLSIAESA